MDDYLAIVAAALDQALNFLGPEGTASKFILSGKGLAEPITLKGTLGTVDQETALRLGGDDAPIKASLFVTRTDAPAGFAPVRGMTVTAAAGGPTYQIHGVGTDEVSWTLTLHDN